MLFAGPGHLGALFRLVRPYHEVVAAARPQWSQAIRAEQFELLRVVDNVRYPAFCYCCGLPYELQVWPEPLRSR